MGGYACASFELSVTNEISTSNSTIAAAPVNPAGLLFLGYHVMTFKRWSDEFPYVLRFLVCFAAMIVELLWENVMVW